MSINQSINQYYCDNFHVQNLFPEYLYLVGEIFTSRSPSDPDVTIGIFFNQKFITNSPLQFSSQFFQFPL